MSRPFFSVTEDFRRQHVALYDFVHGTTAAIWNTRWQVDGYLRAAPDATAADLEARFVRGSGLLRVNVRRTFAVQGYDEQCEELARITLINSIALYEGWLAALKDSLSAPKSAIDRLQFPSQGVQGRPDPGVREALVSLTSPISMAMATEITPRLRLRREYRLGELDDLLLIYRSFKEARNALVHNGGVATQRLVDAHAQTANVTKASVGLKAVPQLEPPVEGEPTRLSLYGVIGFGAVVFHVVATIDAELSQTKGAEREFVERFRKRYGGKSMPSAEPRRVERLRALTASLGYPRPDSVQALWAVLRAEGVVN